MTKPEALKLMRMLFAMESWVCTGQMFCGGGLKPHCGRKRGCE